MQQNPEKGDTHALADTDKDGDGQLLAEYDGKGLYFHAKLEGIHRKTFGNDEAHLLQIKLHFMKPFSRRNRYRGAKIDVKVTKSSGENSKEPRIMRIAPEANSLHVSDLEVTTGETVTAGGGGSGGPANVNVSVERSKGKKTSYQGVRLIHGVIKGPGAASWKFYEDSASETGLPPVIHLLLLVYCESHFSLDVDMSVRYKNFWRLLSEVSAPKETGRWGCMIPSLDTIEERAGLEMAGSVQRLLQRAKKLNESEHKRLKDFEETLNDEFPSHNLTNDMRNQVNEAEKAAKAIVFKIRDAKRHRISDSEALVLLRYYVSIRRNIQDKQEKDILAGESWDVSLGIQELEQAGADHFVNTLIEELRVDADNAASSAYQDANDEQNLLGRRLPRKEEPESEESVQSFRESQAEGPIRQESIGESSQLERVSVVEGDRHKRTRKPHIITGNTASDNAIQFNSPITESYFRNFIPVGPGFAVSRLS